MLAAARLRLLMLQHVSSSSNLLLNIRVVRMVANFDPRYYMIP